MVQHGGLKLCSRQPWQPRRARVLLVLALRHVVAVAATVLLGGVKRRQGATVVAEHDALEQVRHRRPGGVAANPTVGGEDGVHLVPQLSVDDRWMLGLVPLLLVAQFTEVGPVVEQLVDQPLVDRLAVSGLAVLRGPRLGRHAVELQLLEQHRAGAQFNEALEDVPDELGLTFVGHQSAVLDVVTEGRHAAHPHALALTGGDLVADALAGDLALELCEGQQDVQHQPPHRRGGVELLGDRHERHAIALEHLDHLGEVREAARQAVDLVDDDHIDLAGLDVGHQSSQRWAFHVAAREGRIIVVVCHRNPSLGALAGDVGMPRITLCVDRVVFLVQPLVGGLARVDRAAHTAFQCFAHRQPPFLEVGFVADGLSPKNNGPDHRVPVISRAIMERLGYIRP
ncbi:hypothetical protein FERRO_15930 [Ferrovum sp. JA12]|nr:hypothetical protein FERRO_15930 [Ferrovum sp. JA12]